MCLIAYAPKGQMIPRHVLSHAAFQNDDGIGIMSKLGVNKYLGKKMVKKARRYIETVLVPENIPYAIHFRWATHGDVNLDNTHPYKTPEGTHYVMHNGIISLTTAESSAAESDTAVYVRKYLAEMDKFDPKRTGAHIGYSNKLVIMDKSGNFVVCNESQGDWIEGVWYSNTYSLPSSFVPARSYAGTGYQGGWGGHTGYESDYGDVQTTMGTSKFWHKDWRFCAQTGDWYNPDTHEVVLKNWQSGHKSYMVVRKEFSGSKVIELHPKVEKVSGNKDFPVKGIAILPARAAVWSNEDRAAYYEGLEAGLTAEEAEDYMDTGYLSQGMDAGERAALEVSTQIREFNESKIVSDEELASLREQQGAILAATMKPHDKPEAPIGGDFPLLEACPTERDEPEWRKTLRAIAATIHV